VNVEVGHQVLAWSDVESLPSMPGDAEFLDYQSAFAPGGLTQGRLEMSASLHASLVELVLA